MDAKKTRQPAIVDDLRKMLHKNYLDEHNQVVQTSRIVYGFDDEAQEPWIVFQYVRQPLRGYFMSVENFNRTFAPVDG